MADFAPARQKLEFDKVVERISQLAVSEPAKDRAHFIEPSTDRNQIEQELRRVSEAKELLIAEGSIPLDGVKNILAPLKHTAVENRMLTTRQLLDIGSTLQASRVLAHFLSKRKALSPELHHIAHTLFVDQMLEKHINDALDGEGNVRDSASKELEKIRREISVGKDQLRKRLETILKRTSEKDIVQEEIITTRDGRMVIPVKVEYKYQVPGFIHSSSASGATVYIEPAETLELNNALRELQFKEQREIERILNLLTIQVSEVREELIGCLDVLTALDLIFAKAKYSIEVLGHAPRIFDRPQLALSQARHPVLLQRHPRDEVIPFDLELGEEATTLVITGPNAGGKSVTLKTVGLLAFCAQSGMHIPAAPDSGLGIFKNIFVDIGDDQSIENDLSTFSSHLDRMKGILEEADENSLVLIDEIGAGTDPAEGGALAAAVLLNLTRRRTLTIATTHHGNLKAFAHQTLGVVNGSMEFDQKSLRPTYRFQYGVPGSSYALELAERMGLPTSVLHDARSHLGEEKSALETLLIELEQQVQAYRQQVQEASLERERLGKLMESYEGKMRESTSELRSLRKTASKEAQDLIKNAQTLIERSIKEIRESQAQPRVIRESHEQLRKFVSDLANTSEPEEESPQDSFVLGDLVRLREGTEVGEIVELKRDVATVLWSHGRLRVKVRDLIKQERHPASPVGYHEPSYVPQARSEVDLRGLLGDEAVTIAQSFLDNAYVAGLHRVDIIHGKGTGSLRKRIAQFLKEHPHVKSFRLGEWNEGGAGVTVVELSD